MTDWDLIGDVGGTNARFARLSKGTIKDIKTFDTKGDTPLLTLIETFLLRHNEKPKSIILAVAGVVHPTYARLTNAEQLVYLSDLVVLTKTQQAFLINDYEAAAWSLAHIGAKDVKSVCGPPKPPKGHRLIIGSGTGLGVGMLIDCGSHCLAVPGEGGHIGLAPKNEFDADIFKALRQIWPDAFMADQGWRIEAEGILSGTGLPLLYKAVCTVMNKPQTCKDITQIFKLNRVQDVCADICLSMFSFYLGALAGDFALTLSSKGGVFMTGGVVLKNPSLLDDHFVDGFQKGGRHTSAREKFPIYLFKNQQFGLEGAKNALDQKLAYNQ